jgi:tetratricopeptide (TPR) repeat protein
LALGQVGEPDREGVLRVLLADDAEAIQKRLGAELLVVWGRPDEGWALLESALSVSRAEAATELQLFADRLRRIQTKESARIRAYANERLASYVDGEETERARLDAAQAYADAGDLASARRMLEGISDLNDGSFANVGAGVATLIRVTAESGRVDEAEERLEEWESQLRPSEAQRLRETIGWAWVLSGEFDRAAEILGSDSTVSAYAIIGWASLYAGNLRVAKEHFLVAGPFAQSREQATRRTSMLALLQGVEPDTVPALGEALLWLERADTTKALDELEHVARELPDSGGRSPVLTLAGGIAREIGDLERAESLLVDALNADSTGASAASAEYALGLVLADGDRGEAAAERLEHMILTHPGSALVPEARRLLDQVRGAIPDDD